MSYRRYTAALLLPVMIVQLAGCTKTVLVGPQDLNPPDYEDVKAVITVDSEVVSFDSGTRTVVENDTVYARVDSKAYSIGVSEVREFALTRTDSASLTVGSLVVAGTLMIFWIATFVTNLEPY